MWPNIAAWTWVSTEAVSVSVLMYFYWICSAVQPGPGVGSTNIAHTPHCTFTANRIHISLDLQSSAEGPVASSFAAYSFSYCPSLCLSALPLCATSLLPLAAHERPITRTFHSLATRHVALFAVLCCAVLCASIAKGRGCSVGCVERGSQFMT